MRPKSGPVVAHRRRINAWAGRAAALPGRPGEAAEQPSDGAFVSFSQLRRKRSGPGFAASLRPRVPVTPRSLPWCPS
jgi:hypothetical protein